MLLIHDDLVRADIAHRHGALLREQRGRRLAAAARATEVAEREVRRARRLLASVIPADL